MDTAIPAAIPAGALTLDAEAYRPDPARFAAERRAIFGREWLLIAREESLGQPGAYVAEEIAGWPVFVIRDREGGLRAFHNVCRHRAGPLVWDGEGRCDVLRCRYHGWVYDTTGRLRRMPDFGEEEGLDKAQYGLFPVRVEAWRGLVFVNLDLNAPPLPEALGGFAEACAPFPMETFRFHSAAVHEIGCNWKTYVDNYMEGYHVPVLHPGLDREIDSKQYRVIDGGRFARHQAPQRSGAAYSGVWLWRFPNLALNVFANGMNVERMMPVGPGRTRLVYAYYFGEQATRAEIDAAIAASAQVTAEDKLICEAVQRNLDAGLYDRGRLSPRHENGVWQFHDLVRRALAGG